MKEQVKCPLQEAVVERVSCGSQYRAAEMERMMKVED
jgi:hypothetical protein